MSFQKVYNEGYPFAKERNEANVRRLKIISLVFPLLIIVVLCSSVIFSLGIFKSKTSKVSSVFPQATQKSAEEAQEVARENAYKEAKIPYEDPSGKFSIRFMTPYVSDQIAVVINTRKDYDKAKAEADSIVNAAKEKVQITSVSYVNNF